MSVARSLTIAAAAGVLLHAQATPPRAGAAGTVEHVKVHGRSLEGNLEGDSPDRDVTIYLPPSYAADRARRYPVVYLLHGYSGKDDTFNGRLATVAESEDTLVATGTAREMIVVTPNAFSLHKGSMYSNSVTTGDWETYIAHDLVAYMDAHYRTIADRMGRGLAGHSMGGYGAVRIGMKRPDVFSSLYILSACCLTAQLNPRPEAMAAAEAIKTREAAEEAGRGPGFGPSVNLAEGAAWSPNPGNPPLYLDLPVKDGKVQPGIVAKWAANSPLAMVDQYVANLKAYGAIAMDVGTKDNLDASNKQLEQTFTRFGIAHTFEEYDGDHTNRIRERIEMKVLPFFSKNLAFASRMPASTSTPSAPAGTVAHVKVHGRSLEGNLEGESPDRDVTIYLPPSYTTGGRRRYPVIYLLHGYGGTDATWTGRIANVPVLADKTARSGAAREMIVVMPDAYSIYQGSMYSNSVTAGDWEGYVAHDLVSYMDSHYRTLADRMSRGLAGHSMGGYGTVRIGMKHPDVFSSIYALSACCLSANVNPRPESLAAAEAVHTKEDVARAAKGLRSPLGTLARAAAWSPNPDNPPLYLDLPIKDGKIRPEIVAKWAANAPLSMIDEYIPSLKMLHAIAFDIGNQDEAVPPRTIKELDAVLTASGVAHTYETYEGTHTSKIAERIETRMLPFFSHNLTFDAKTTPVSSTRH